MEDSMTRRRSFTTIDDVTAYLIELEPGFADLDHETLRDVVRTRKRGRYEDIEEDEIDLMYQDAMLHTSVAHDEG
jgi:uncharacterized protein (UPF0335 family)